MMKVREEASIATAGNFTYVIGGVGEKTVEYVDFSHFSIDQLNKPKNLIPKTRQKSGNDKSSELPQWKLGTSLPDMRARGCAVAKGTDKIYFIGESEYAT